MDGDRAAEACPKFEESNRLEPSAGTLLNLGKCYETLKRTATAWATYKKAISLGKSTGETRQVGAAEEYLAAIEPRLARLTVKVAAQTPGLTIERIDSHGIHTVIAEASRGVPVNVDPDRYQVKASAPGFTTYTTGVELDTDAEAKSVEIPELVKIEHHDTAPIPVKSSGPDRLLVTGVVLASVGVISAAVGIGFGVTTLSDSNTALSDKSLCPNHACTAKGLSLIERAKTESTASTVSLSLGAALAVVGTTMFTWSVVHAKSESDRGDAQKPSAGSDITFVPSAVVLPNGPVRRLLRGARHPVKGSGAPIVLLLGAGLFLGVGCNLVADLGSFHPAGSGGSSSSTTISTGGNGGAADQGSSTVATSVGGGSITTSTVGPGSSSSQSTGGNQCSPYVLISEVNINDDYVELWNPTDTLFSLSGATITARGSSGNDTKKWTGLDSDTIDAGQYFVVGSSGMKPPAQAKLSSNLTNSSPTVIVFQDSVGDIIDSVCICSAAGCSYMFEGSTEVCAHPALSADFFLDNNPISAERISCVDTDHGSDFTFDCETPDAPYGSACAPQ